MVDADRGEKRGEEWEERKETQDTGHTGQRERGG